MFDARVLSPESASEDRILRLIDGVEGLLFSRGLPVGDPWDTRTDFTFLLETWTVEQGQQVTQDTLIAQLRRHWETSALQVVSYLVGLEPKPLTDHQTLTALVEADGRELVQAIVAQAFTDDQIHLAREAAMHVSHIAHLRAIAVDITSITLFGNKIRAFRQAAHNSGQHEVAIGAAGAGFLVEEAREATTRALTNMTSCEVLRLGLDPDHHFQTACLEAFTARNRTTRLDDRLKGRERNFWAAALVTRAYRRGQPGARRRIPLGRRRTDSDAA